MEKKIFDEVLKVVSENLVHANLKGKDPEKKAAALDYYGSALKINGFDDTQKTLLNAQELLIKNSGTKDSSWENTYNSVQVTIWNLRKELFPNRLLENPPRAKPSTHVGTLTKKTAMSDFNTSKTDTAKRATPAAVFHTPDSTPDGQSRRRPTH